MAASALTCAGSWGCSWNNRNRNRTETVQAADDAIKLAAVRCGQEERRECCCIGLQVSPNAFWLSYSLCVALSFLLPRYLETETIFVIVLLFTTTVDLKQRNHDESDCVNILFLLNTFHSGVILSIKRFPICVESLFSEAKSNCANKTYHKYW